MNRLCDWLMFPRLHNFLSKLWHGGLILVLCLGLGLGGCQAKSQISPAPSSPPISVANLSEVSPPAALEELNEWFEPYQPDIEILSPQPDEVLPDTRVSLQLAVRGLPIFRDLVTGLGPYLQVTLDNQASRSIYSVDQPIVIEDLSPGTHTLRVVAVRPWGESFKTAGAFAQVTFHTLTRSQENTPKPQQPLLTYNQPQGIYGSEPFLLDFYLSNAPLHSLAQTDDSLSDWQVRCTINGTSFKVDQWQPFYLTGLKPGKNWVRLELLDERGNLIETAFNPTTWAVDYQPGGQDVRSRLLRGELTAAQVQGILSQNLESTLPTLSPPESETRPTETIPEPAPTPVVPEPASALEPQPPEPVAPPSELSAAQETQEDLELPEDNEAVTSGPTTTPEPQQRSWRNFLNRKQTDQPPPQAPVVSSPSSEEEREEVTSQVDQVDNVSPTEIVSSENLENEPRPEASTVVEPEPPRPTPQDWKKRWQNYLSRPQSAPSPSAASANAPEPSPPLETTTAEE